MNNTPTLILAPMAGFTDSPFRKLCRKHGADVTVTEMVSSVATVFNDEKTLKLAHIDAGDSPSGVQLFGHDPDTVAKAAVITVEKHMGEIPSFIDINMGCPVKKIFNSGDGSALMESPALCGEIVYKTKKALEPYNIPVTVKIRAGVDAEHLNAVPVAVKCAEAGACAITVHARTRDEMYTPGIRPEIIKAVRDAVPQEVKVIGNGDIASVDDAAKMLRETGCDGLMIGRASLGDPWIFSGIKRGLTMKDYSEPTVEDRVHTAVSLVRDIVELKGEFSGIHEARGRASHFIRGIPGAAAVRGRLNSAETLAEFESIISELL